LFSRYTLTPNVFVEDNMCCKQDSYRVVVGTLFEIPFTV